MNAGKVKFFNGTKGFWFIIANDGKEYFVHISGVVGNEELEEGQNVTFDIEQGKRGLMAVNVNVVD